MTSVIHDRPDTMTMQDYERMGFVALDIEEFDINEGHLPQSLSLQGYNLRSSRDSKSKELFDSAMIMTEKVTLIGKEFASSSQLQQHDAPKQGREIVRTASSHFILNNITTNIQ
jgi:hypothetical protein